jgi:hypothetical protein
MNVGLVFKRERGDLARLNALLSHLNLYSH